MLNVQPRARRCAGLIVLVALALAGCSAPGGGPDHPAWHGEHAEAPAADDAADASQAQASQEPSPADGHDPAAADGHGSGGGHDGGDQGGGGGHEGHGDVEYIVPEGFEEALAQVTTERGREILSDWLVTAAEVDDLRQAQVECLAADGYDVGLQDGALQVRGVPDGVAGEDVGAAVEACLGDLPVIAPLYAQTQGGT
ncbi:hypothetical protein DNL40_13925 [Xylanimonas oleitrophica]|uniref:Uncharacterized protein n=1 Tax=Xylanimonas oleitrophica TaxID=2607479 RepID=A0A2W5Y2P5_9MICO|nr:hypothetical protein [Xylanimonas oleitrophica]PZR51914.1 hypothetical protein DNL40_13925 [Xylanimonas oleitrophica]